MCSSSPSLSRSQVLTPPGILAAAPVSAAAVLVNVAAQPLLSARRAQGAPQRSGSQSAAVPAARERAVATQAAAPSRAAPASGGSSVALSAGSVKGPVVPRRAMAPPPLWTAAAMPQAGVPSARISPQTAPAAGREPKDRLFDQVDRNHDGAISRGELARAMQTGIVREGGRGSSSVGSVASPGTPPLLPDTAQTIWTVATSSVAAPTSAPTSPPVPIVGAATPMVMAALAPPPMNERNINDAILQAEISRRQAAEARVRELESLVARLRGRISTLEGKRTVSPPKHAEAEREEVTVDDPIDRAICEYLERNPDFPVSIQKVAPNYYVFGDRGTVYVTQRGEHIVVRVGGGFKSLQVFMDERALMVTRDSAGALAEKTQNGPAHPA